MIRRASLRTRFVLAALACLLPLLGVVFYVVLRTLDYSRDQLAQTEVAVADLVSQTVVQTLQDYDGILEDAARAEEVQRLDSAGSEAVLASFIPGRPNVKELFLFDPEGELIAAKGGLDPDLLRPRFQTALDRAIAGDVGVSGRVELDEGDVIALVAPVWQDNKDDGQPVGAVGLMFSAARLDAALQPLGDGDTVIAVVAESGVIAPRAAAETGGRDLTERLTEPIAVAVAGGRGSHDYREDGGVQRLAVYTPIGFADVGWAALVSNPSPTTYGPNRTLLRNGLFVLATAGVLTLVIALLLGEIMARPLRLLTRQVSALAGGDYDQSVQTVGGGEVRDLSIAFQEMADRLVAQVRDLGSAREERERQAEQLRDLHRRTLRLQEDERRRIAAEIHDAVSPLITGALYQARALRLTNGATEPAARDEALAAIGDHLEGATEELHGVIFALRPPDLDDIGVVAAIERYAAGIGRSGLTCHLDVIGEIPDLAPEVRIGVYRIVQEALHNVLRHAGADEAVVRLEALDGVALRVTIRDNGAGFDPEREVRPTSLGLLSMRERAAAIGATLEIRARPGGGTAIVIERPMDAELVGPIAGDGALEAFERASSAIGDEGTGGGDRAAEPASERASARLVGAMEAP